MVKFSGLQAEFETTDGLRVSLMLSVEDPQAGAAHLVANELLRQIQDYIDFEENVFNGTVLDVDFELITDLAEGW
jgi:hypothetical protein